MRETAPPPRKAIVEWLKQRLSHGPVPAKVLFEEADELDVTRARLRTASSSLGVRPFKDGYQGLWWWSLPSDGPSAIEVAVSKGFVPKEPAKIVFPDRPKEEINFDAFRLSGKKEPK